MNNNLATYVKQYVFQCNNVTCRRNKTIVGTYGKDRGIFSATQTTCVTSKSTQLKNWKLDLKKDAHT